MRYSEFKPACKATADAYKKKAADKAKEKKQREWLGKNSSNKRDEELKKGTLKAISKLLANTDDKSVKVATIKSDVI